MKSSVFSRAARCAFLLLGSLTLGGCGALLPRLDLQTEPPRMAIAPPALDADKLVACFSKPLARYVETVAGRAPP